HPSFRMNLRGRRDLVLAKASGGSQLAIDQREGPLELIHLDSGLTVLELPEGRRTVTLSVPSGRYVLRRSVGGTVRATEVTIGSDSTMHVDEGDLDLVGEDALTARGRLPRPMTHTTLPA